MKRRVIVHIGMHKTGSSSIQHTLYRRPADASFAYADLGSANHSEKIYSLFSSSPQTYHMHRIRGRAKEEIERFNDNVRKCLVRCLSEQASQDLIISGEGIVRLDAEGLSWFRRFLLDFCDRVTIVAYVRSPRSYMESVFQQPIKGKSKMPLMVSRLYPNYRVKLEPFDLAFGSENVHLWKYDITSFPQGDVVLDFCKRLGITIQPEAVRRFNNPLSRDALSLLLAYRKFGPGYGVGIHAFPENTRLIAALRSIGIGKIRIAPELIAPVLEANRADIQWMEERLGESLDEDLDGAVDDIRSEEDLLNIDPAAVTALKDLIGKEFLPEGNAGQTPQEAAMLVHALREKLVAKQPTGSRPLLSSPGMGELSSALPLKHSLAAAAIEPGLIVLGMHRSGTSCLAGMLQSAGFAVSEVEAWNMHNQRGNRENRQIGLLNDSVLRKNHADWDNPPTGDICSFVDDDLRLKRNAVLSEFAELGRPWMFKDPRTLLTLPFWREAVLHPYRIGIFRHPIRVALSLYSRSQMPIARGLSLWLAYNRALAAEHERSPFPLLCFDLPPAEFLNSAVSAVQQECGGLVERGLLDLAKMRSFYTPELVHHNAGDPEEVIAGLPADDEIVKETQWLYERLCALAAVDDRAVVRTASKVLATKPLATLMAADKAVKDGDIDLALKLYHQALPIASNALDIWHRIITMLQEHKRPDDAVRACDEALISFPANPGLLMEKAIAKEQLGGRGEALEILERVLSAVPAWPKPWSLKGEWLFSEGRWNEAIEALQQCIRLLPPDKAWPRHVRMAEAYLRAGKVEDGNAAFQKALEFSLLKDHAEIYRRWSHELRRAGHVELAHRFQERAAALAG